MLCTKLKAKLWFFYRTSNFTANESYTPLTYDNVRPFYSPTIGSLDIYTGIFSAPIEGVYQFSMMALPVIENI